MTRAVKFNELVRSRVRSLHESGKTHAEIRAALARDGVKPPPSTGWINAACRSPAGPPTPAVALPTQAPPTNIPASAREEEPPPHDEASATDIRGMLRRQVVALEKMASKSNAAGNASESAALARVVNATSALLAKLEPPPPVDFNAAPDMVAAATRGRELLHKLLSRALKDAGG